jgi:NADPH-dependent 2,4-dienoyl-CoA reductase/sulfur reductase-like enzyme/rhodanese-related sulfurtransferase
MGQDGEKGLRIVVVGASAAGLRAAARAKRLLPNAEVTVVDAETIISYGACGLPYYLSGDIESPRPLRTTAWGVIRDPGFFRHVKALNVLNGTRAILIDASAKTLEIEKLTTGEKSTLEYDKLVLATGAEPILLPGCEGNERISSFKTIEDAREWRMKLEANELDRVAIIGSGFIGIELAEAFTSMWGVGVDLIEAQGYVLPQLLDPEMAALVEAHLTAQGVTLHKSCCVSGITATDEGLSIATDSKTVKASHAIVALGVRPNVELAKTAGIETGQRGGIVVNDAMETNVPDIYAAGDCIEVELISGGKAVIPLGSLANKQGRLIGNQLAGRDTRFHKVAGSACVKVFDFNVASTGLTKVAAERAGIEAKEAWGAFSGMAHYYPDDKSISVKLVYEPGSLKVLGVQALGEGDSVKRIDVAGNLILNGGTVGDLLDLEFAYSPPYSPALDPLYAIGCVALNQEEDELTCISPDAALNGEATILDVRTEPESEANPVNAEGVLNIALEQIRERLDDVPEGKPVVVVCAKGVRSAEAARVLLQSGRSGTVYSGGGVFMRPKAKG